jgi:hypothetical protein
MAEQKYARMNACKFHAPFSMASLFSASSLSLTSPFSAFALDFSRDDDDDDDGGAACLLLRLASPICRHHTRSLIVTAIVRGDVIIVIAVIEVGGLVRVLARMDARRYISRVHVGQEGGGYDVQYVYLCTSLRTMTFLLSTVIRCAILQDNNSPSTYLHITIGLHSVVELITRRG